MTTCTGIAVFGDSTVDGEKTEPWTRNTTDSAGNAVANHYHNGEAPAAWPSLTDRPYLRVFNCGYAGKALIDDWAANNIAKAVFNNTTAPGLSHVFLVFGLNDLIRASWSGELFRQKYSELISMVRAQGLVPVVVTSDPQSNNPVIPEAQVQEILVPLQKQIATENNTLLFDLNAKMRTWSDWKSYQPDGIHFGNEGHLRKMEFASQFIASTQQKKVKIMSTSIIAPDVEFTNYIGKGNFLGAYPDAMAAYSLRKIGTRYVGPLIRIRRSSDNVEQDFFERYGSVNIDEVKAFTGTGGSAFVSVWYDQSGNGNHAFQPVVDNQPVVIRTGTVILFNSKNALMFDGVNDCLQLPENVARQFNDGVTDFSVFSAVIPRQVAQGFTALSLAARDSETANGNDMMSLQINAAYSGGDRKSVGTLFRKATASSLTDITAIGNGSPANNVPVFCGVTREAGALTLNDATTTATKSGMTTDALNLSLATIGAVRRGVNGNVEAANANSKIAELIVYKKSYQTQIAAIIANMAAYYI